MDRINLQDPIIFVYLSCMFRVLVYHIWLYWSGISNCWIYFIILSLEEEGERICMVKVGDKIYITSDNGTYNKYRSKVWKVIHIAQSIDEHQGYDESLYPTKLVSCKGLPFSLYEWEFDIV